jgi:hypothetical protein
MWMIELYGKYQLKDGRTGYAVDILGDGDACVFELIKKGLDDKVIIVTKEEIEKKIS